MPKNAFISFISLILIEIFTISRRIQAGIQQERTQTGCAINQSINQSLLITVLFNEQKQGLGSDVQK